VPRWSEAGWLTLDEAGPTDVRQRRGGSLHNR